ncbi:putative peroxygenase 5 [Hibiscus syriacus]|uniref:Peroxygenase 5 n=1 Tax=Hibiscus syriacus TaxID=106335 RepID=A0A6A2Z699_HIBSY|nr:probable peroxygenase 5 [Hibiscus syriacus]KAE8687368.1 putative peroxygenase 5 [Hibiscus syriacus]
MDSSSPSKDLQGGTAMAADQSPLQKHVEFFDRNHDGLVYPWETFKGLRAIGAGYLLSIAGAAFINLSLSGKTRPGKFPSLLFPIEIKNMHLGIHGSDTGVYDSEGRFVPSKFEEIFNKYAGTHANALTSDELTAMLKANREPKDVKGWIGSLAEWKILYVLCKDENGLLRKETIKGVYDGSLFEHLERERAASS